MEVDSWVFVACLGLLVERNIQCDVKKIKN